MSLYKTLMGFAELNEGRPFGTANQEKTRAARMGLVHLGGPYYGPKKGQPATHISVKRNPNDPKEVPDIRPMTKKEKQEQERSLGEPQKKINPKNTKSLANYKIGKNGEVSPQQPPAVTKAQQIIQATTPGQVPEQMKQELRKVDTNRVEKYLRMTVQDAKLNRGQAGTGLGTDDSRAGECATVGCFQNLISTFKGKIVTDKKSRDMLRQSAFDATNAYFQNLDKQRMEAEQAGSKWVLSKSWINSSHAQVNTLLKEVVGIENIREAVWDTPEGRHLVGTEGHGTSADMFILMANGKRVGVSLKKDGNVNMSNPGLNTVVDEFIPLLQEEGMSSNEIIKFQDSLVSNGEYKRQVDTSLGAVQSFYRKNTSFRTEMNGVIKQLQTGKLPDTHKTTKYLVPKILDTLFTVDPDKLSVAQKKALTRLTLHMMHSKIHGQTALKFKSQIYGGRNALNRRLMTWLHDSPAVDSGMKEIVFSGAHMYEALGIGLQDKKLERFVTIYGGETPENGSIMDGKQLIQFFAPDSPNFEKYVIAAQKGSKADINAVKRIVKNRITVDWTAGNRGFVKYARRNPAPPPPILSYQLFTLETTVRGVGTAPVLTLRQSDGLSNALQYGTDISKWPPRKREYYYKSRYIENLERLQDQAEGTPTYKNLMKDMTQLRSQFKYTPELDQRELAKIQKRRAAEEESDE